MSLTSTCDAKADSRVSDVVSALHEDNVVVIQRESDGYINATKMVAGTGRFWNNYFENKETTNVLNEISDNTGIPAISGVDTRGLVDSRRGRNGGTWVHPRVAIHFAGWISPKFAAAVTDVVDRYTKGEVTTEESKAVKAKIEKGKEKAGKVRQQDAYGDQWWIYVRCYLETMGLPSEAAESVVVLSKGLIKFGITGVLSTRNSGYSNDRGYFEYAFPCTSFSESKKAESLIGVAFSGCKLEGKQEYLKVSKAADVLGVRVADSGATDDQYTYLALNLYARIVKTLHDLNPDHKGKFGYRFEAIPEIEEVGGSSSSALTNHTFVRTELGAEDMPPSYDTVFPTQCEKIRKLELDAEVEKHRITAICSLTDVALTNPDVDESKLRILLQNIHLAFPQEKGQSSLQMPQPTAPSQKHKLEEAACLEEIEEFQTRLNKDLRAFISENLIDDEKTWLLWTDLFAAYNNHKGNEDKLKRVEMMKALETQGFHYTDTNIRHADGSTIRFKGYKGWKLRDNSPKNVPLSN